MSERRRPLRIACPFALALLAAGCVSPDAVTVETVVHPDGSCDRTIEQPRAKLLPAEALKPEWNALWKSVTTTKGPPASPRDGFPDGAEDYFLARGSFRSPREIPPHYRRVDDRFPEVGASEIRRTYERLDRAFVVEHRWSERITDVVTLPGFLEARDKVLDILLPLGLRLLGEALGPDYDLSGLSDFARKDLRRALEEGSVLVYDAGVSRRLLRDDGAIDPELAGRLAAISRRIGLDPLDAGGKPLAPEEFDRRLTDFFRRTMMKSIRHRDGSPMERSEADSVIARARQDPAFLKLDRRQQDRLDRFVGPMVSRMTGLYCIPPVFFPGSPRFAFALKLPGELVETNGVGVRDGRTHWSFTGDQLFPAGYEMKARSLEIDREAQKKALGKVPIADAETALEFVELIGEDRSLLDAVRKLREAGDRAPLADDRGRSSQQASRARRLRELLAVGTPAPG